MKKALLLSLVLAGFSSIASAGNGESSLSSSLLKPLSAPHCENTVNGFGMNMYYVLGMPKGTMGQSMNTSHGMGIDLFVRPKRSRFQTGISLAFNVYANHNEPFSFTALDGSTINTELDITNNYSNTSLFARVDLGPQNAFIQPYLESRVGYTFFRTSLWIDDPEDEDNCQPLVNEVLKRDNTPSVYAGGGLNFNLPDSRSEKSRGIDIFISGGYNYGGNVRYLNVDPAQANTASGGGTHTHSTGTSTESAPLAVQFINPVTKVVHTHDVGYEYNSPLRILEFHLGIRISL